MVEGERGERGREKGERVIEERDGTFSPAQKLKLTAKLQLGYLCLEAETQEEKAS